MKKILITIVAIITYGSLTFAQQFSIVSGPNVGSNTANSYPAPFGNNSLGVKHQFFISASELSGSGVPSNASISSIGFNVIAFNNATTNYSNFNLKIYTTASFNPLSGGYVTSPQIAQFSSASLVVNATGWVQLNFASPFVWNGTLGLVIETCFRNSTSTANISTEFCNSTSGANPLTRFYATSLSTVCSSTSLASVSSNRPVVRFGWYPPAPTSILPSNPTVCQGSNITFTANGAYGTVHWSQLGFPLGTGSSITVNPPGGNGSFVQYEAYNVFNGDSSLSPAITTVQVFGPSNAGLASNNQTICRGSVPASLTLGTSLGGIQWQDSSASQGGWANLTGATSSTLNAVTSIGALFEKTHYRAVVTNGACPSDTSNEVIIDIWQLPNVSAGNDQTICQGDSAILVGTGSATTYTWSGGVVLVTNGAPFYPPTSSNYIVTGVDLNGCINRDTVLVSVSTPTVAGIASSVPAAVIPAYVPFNGLVGYWPFTGNANDVSGNNNNGVVNGAVLTSDRFGNLSSAYTFDGVNDVISMNAVSSALQFNYVTNSYSINLWVKSNDPNLGALSSRVFHHDDANNGYPSSMQVQYTSNALYMLAVDVSNSCQDSIFNVFDGRWRMLTMVMDNGQDSLFGYLDGQRAFALLNNLTTFQAPSDTITIGNLSNLSRPYAGQIDDIGIWNRALRPDEIQRLYQSFQALCLGSAPNNIQLIGSNGTVQWQSSPDGTSWSNIVGATSNQLLAAQMGTLTDTTMYRALVVSGVCDTLTSNVTGINVLTPSVADNVLPTSQTICSGESPALLALNTYTGTIQWQVSVSTVGPWSNLGSDNDTLTSAQMGVLTATRYYRAIVRNNPCASDTSFIATVTVVPGSNAGVASSNQQICSGSSPATLNLTGAVYNTLLKWQKSTDNLNWIDIAGANNTSYSPGTLIITTYYRSIAQNGTCPLDTSNTVTVTVLPQPLQGNVRNVITGLPSDSVCINGFCDNLNVSGYGGATLFTWQRKSPGGSWANVITATNSDNIPGVNVGALNLAGIWYVRVLITNSTCANSVYSDSIPIVVFSNPVGGTTSTTNNLVCFGSPPAASINLASSVGSISWQSAPASTGPWSTINGANATTLQPNQVGLLTDTTYFRAELTNGVCTPVYSSITVVNVRASTVAGTASSNQTICNGKIPNGLAVTGYAGQYFLWQWASNSNGPWGNVTSVTSTTPSISSTQMTSAAGGGTFVSTRYYRVIVINSPCPNDTSNIVTINVNSLPVVNAGLDFSICAGSQATLSGSGTVTYTWSGGVVNNVPFTPNASAAYTVIGTDANGCTASDAVVVIVNQPSVGGVAILSPSNPNVCFGTLPPSNVVLSGYTATFIQWQSSPNPNGPWTNIGANSATLSPSQVGLLFDTLYIRAQVNSGACPAVVSNTVVFNVFSVSEAGSASVMGSPGSSTQTICYATSPTGLVLSNFNGGESAISWRYRTTTTGAFTAIPATANDTLLANQMTAASGGGTFMSNRYYVAIVTNGPCIADTSNIISVLVDPLSDTATVVPSAPQNICLGGSPSALSLSGTYLGSIQWQSAPTATGPWVNVSGATGTSFSAFGALTDTIFYRASFTSGVCAPAYSNVVTINVNAPSFAGIIQPATQTICTGSTPVALSLSGAIGTTYKWERSVDGVTWPTTTIGTSTTLTLGAQTTTYYYRAIVTNAGCTSDTTNVTAQITVVSNPATGTSTISSNQTICAGTTPNNISVTAGYTGVVQWQWSLNGSIWNDSLSWTGPTLPGSVLVAGIGAITDTIFIRAKYKNPPCTSVSYSSIHTIFVVPGSDAGIISSTGQTICINGIPVNIGLVSGTTVGSDINWLWSADSLNWTAASPIINSTTLLGSLMNTQLGGAITSTRYYRARVKNNTCPADSSLPHKVTVVQPSVGVATSNQVICANNSPLPIGVPAQFVVGNQLSWERATNSPLYNNWTAITGANSPSLSIGVLTDTTHYRLKVNSSLCLASQAVYSNSVIITVNPNPVVTVAPNQTICAGNTVNLNGVSSVTPATYAWVPQTGLSATNIANPTATPPAGTFQYVLVVTTTPTSGPGCTGSASTTITVNPTPTSNIVTNGPPTICSGQPYLFTFSGSGASLVQWQLNGSNITNATSPTFIASQQGNYTVQASNGFGCSAVSSPVFLTVNALPVINAGANQQICLGDSVTLSATPTSNVTWNNGVVNGVPFAPVTTSNYIVTTTNSNNCTNRDTVMVNVNLPSDSTINVSSLGPYVLNNQTYSQSGTYTQIINNVYGCDSTITLNLVYYGTGLDDPESSSLIIVKPNPSLDGHFQLDYLGLPKEEILQLSVTDLKGKTVYQSNQFTDKLDLSSQVPGFYLLRVSFKKGQSLCKLAIIKS